MATPTTYGSRDRNPFIVPSTYELNGKPVPSNNGDVKYYPLVNSVTGEITVKSPTIAGAISGAGADRTVGTIPKDGVFKPELGSATTSEVQYFTSAVGQTAVKNHAVITAQKAGAQNAQQLIFPNSATLGAGQGQNAPPTADPANPDASSSAAEGAVPVTKEGISKGVGNLTDLGKSIEDGGVRAQYGNWKYPIKFPQTQDRIKFTMFRYLPKTVSAEQISAGGGFGDRPELKDSMGSVTLPIQPQISDLNAVKWGSSEMNALQAMAAAASFATITEGTAGAAAAVEGAAELLKTENSALKTAVGAFLAGEAAGGNKDFLTRVTGAVVNPNLELLFGGPELRSFNFTFTLSAREPDESKEIRRIIRFFKQGMSVKKASTNLFLKTPNIFDIKYYQGGETNEHPWINQIKTCALTNFGVNYTPAGNYATYYDGAMTQYDISMTFSELDPIYDSDYKDDGDTTIGY
jgi:hypothetical protein